MGIIPIFIYVHDKSDLELRREMERDARWNKMMEEEREKERLRKEEEKRKKLEMKKEQERLLRARVEEDIRKNPWQYKILPEGWSIFGQRYITIPWDGENPQPQKGRGYID